MDTSRESLNRILHLNPDLFKVDPSMTTGLSKDSYKRDSFKTLVSLSHRLGSLIVANGVENEEDALVALELGADMLQGSYFSKPQKTEISTTLGLKARIVFVASRFKRLLTEKVTRDKDRKARYEKVASEAFASVQKSFTEEGEEQFLRHLKLYPQLECLYLLDQDGVQITETICSSHMVSERKKYLFQPAPKSTDHSLKDYYYSLVYNGLDRYFTEPYISLASGNLCVTATSNLKNAKDGKPYILCMDIDVTRI
jgi:sensor c-di-GMP phosphodiesterase-like protein